MAKYKRKISAAQRDKLNIERAKILKKAGILSSQTKLHGGRFISPGVLRKVRAYEATADLGYKAYPVSKDIARAAKERGYQVVQGNKVIGPKTPTFRKRIASGKVTGVRPVKGGMMEEVTLPHTVYDMRSLINQLNEGIDTLKLPNEQFAFKYHGNESYRAFMNTQQLIDYLNHYKGFNFEAASMKPEELQEEFEAFTIFRLHPHDVDRNIRGPRRRMEDRKRERMEAIARGEYVGRPRRKRQTREEKAALMPKAQAKRYLAQMAARDKKRRDALLANPEKSAAYKEAARKRAKASRDRKKGK